MIEIPEEQLKYYYRFYNKRVKYTNKLYTKEELFFLSLSDDNFLGLKSYNKKSTLSIKYRDNILSNENESIKAKYYYTVIKALLSNAKRFDIIKPDTNTIPKWIIIESIKILNKSSRYTANKFKSDMKSLNDSKLFTAIDKLSVTIETNKALFDSNHYLYSDRIIDKGMIFSVEKFTKECIYFLKSKPLSTLNEGDIQVISNRKVAQLLNLSDMYISKVIKNINKMYKMSVTCGRGHYAIKDKHYSFKLSIQGETYSSRVVGSRIYANIYFKSKLREGNKIYKKNKITGNRKDSTHKLKLFKPKDSVLLCKQGTLNLINKKIRPGESYTQDNESLANHSFIELNILGKDLKHVKQHAIKLCHTIEFSHHIEEFYGKFIRMNINRNKIKDVYKHLYRHYLNIKEKNKRTSQKFKIMRSLFELEFGHSITSIDRRKLISKKIINI